MYLGALGFANWKFYFGAKAAMYVCMYQTQGVQEKCSLILIIITPFSPKGTRCIKTKLFIIRHFWFFVLYRSVIIIMINNMIIEIEICELIILFLNLRWLDNSGFDLYLERSWSGADRERSKFAKIQTWTIPNYLLQHNY